MTHHNPIVEHFNKMEVLEKEVMHRLLAQLEDSEPYKAEYLISMQDIQAKLKK